MKTAVIIASAAVVGVLARDEPTVKSPSPVVRVVELIKSLKSEIETDGKTEQATYDKYACWCEDTSARKASAIDEARDSIAKLSKKIVDLKGQIGTLQVDVKQAEKDIAANIKSQEEATAIRQKEHDDYAAFREENEAASSAVHGAVNVLAKGSGRTLIEQAETLSVVAGVRSALKVLPKDAVDAEDMAMVRSFLANPIGKKSEGAAFLQASNNPFGDYAPASTQIQGILKNMYDTMVSSLQDAHTEEGTKQRAFEELMQTKKEELEALQVTLAKKKATLGEKKLDLADAKSTRLSTEKQLADDEAFFADTKEACAAKADEWAERTRLRTEELGGINQAITTLEDGADVFKASHTNEGEAAELEKQGKSGDAAAAASKKAGGYEFVQLQYSTESVNLSKAINQIKAMATKSKSLRLASLAVNLRMASHSKTGRDAFADIMAEINKMIANLRQEEQDDIEDREFCIKSKGEIDGDKNSLKDKETNTQNERDATQTKIEELEVEITNAETAKTDQETDLQTALNTRNDEHAEYIAARKLDQQAVSLLTTAISQMSAFYSNNKIAFAQVQQPAADDARDSVDSKYDDAAQKAPETFGDKPYGGRKSESTGVFAILEMIKEDIQKELVETKKAEAESTAEYEKLRAAGMETVATLEALIAKLSTEKAGAEAKKAGLEKTLQNLTESMNASDAEKKAMVKNCAWIKSSFETRRTKRIAEIEGLQTAKSFLMGGGQSAERSGIDSRDVGTLGSEAAAGKL